MESIIARDANNCQAFFAWDALRFTQESDNILNMATLGEIVKELRKSKGFTLAELADNVEGYDAGNLSRFENNKQEIAPDKLKLIAAALNTTVGNIYNLSEGKTSLHAKQDVMQYEAQDLSKYTVNLNSEERQQFKEMCSHFVSLSKKERQLILELTNALWTADSKVKSIMRMRGRESPLTKVKTNDGRTTTEEA